MGSGGRAYSRPGVCLGIIDVVWAELECAAV